MPELPEVETIVRQLRPLLMGQRVVAQEVFDPRLNLNLARLIGASVSGVSRRGKEILLELNAGGALRLAVHLRMTGRLFWVPAQALVPQGRLRAKLVLQAGELWFLDTRRLGTMRLLEPGDGLTGHGIDPLETELSAATLGRLIHGSDQPIKPWLLRQDRLCGVGNIYASESLFRARIHPARSASQLTTAELGRLGQELRTLLEEAVAACGTTFSDYADAQGEAGGFAEFLRVYGKQGLPCPRCRGAIERIVQAGRATFLCAGCQD